MISKTGNFISHFKVYASSVVFKCLLLKELQGTRGSSIIFLEGVRSMCHQVLLLTLTRPSSAFSTATSARATPAAPATSSIATFVRPTVTAPVTRVSHCTLPTPTSSLISTSVPHRVTTTTSPATLVTQACSTRVTEAVLRPPHTPPLTSQMSPSTAAARACSIYRTERNAAKPKPIKCKKKSGLF